MAKQDIITKPQPAALTALELVGSALTQGAGPEQVDKLIELVKFNDEREALKSFNQAFTEAQSEFPSILKDRKAHNAMYAGFSSVVNAVRPVLIKHGLSFRHTIEENNGSVTVTCVLAHKDGHSESTALTAPPDTSGSKNDIQAIGSSVTYLKRYTLEAVTGVVTTDDDTDGNLAPKMVSKDQVSILLKVAAQCEVMESSVCAEYKIKTLDELPADHYQAAGAWIKRQGANNA